MKKMILSIVFAFTVSTFVSATILTERNCVSEAIIAGNAAENTGASYELAYLIAESVYFDCEFSQI